MEIMLEYIVLVAKGYTHLLL